jgi:predicted O-linked N-acetylglucosamine transferase (SPINDLY family)
MDSYKDWLVPIRKKIKYNIRKIESNLQMLNSAKQLESNTGKLKGLISRNQLFLEKEKELLKNQDENIQALLRVRPVQCRYAFDTKVNKNNKEINRQYILGRLIDNSLIERYSIDLTLRPQQNK